MQCLLHPFIFAESEGLGRRLGYANSPQSTFCARGILGKASVLQLNKIQRKECKHPFFL